MKTVGFTNSARFFVSKVKRSNQESQANKTAGDDEKDKKDENLFAPTGSHVEILMHITGRIIPCELLFLLRIKIPSCL